MWVCSLLDPSAQCGALHLIDAQSLLFDEWMNGSCSNTFSSFSVLWGKCPRIWYLRSCNGMPARLACLAPSGAVCMLCALGQSSESPGGLVKTQPAGSHPQSFWINRSGVGREFALLISSQRMLMLLVRDHTLPMPVHFHKGHPSPCIPFELVKVQLKCYHVNKTEHVSKTAPWPSLTFSLLQSPVPAEILILSVQSSLPDLAGLKLLLPGPTATWSSLHFPRSGNWASPSPGLSNLSVEMPTVDMEPFLLLTVPPA